MKTGIECDTVYTCELHRQQKKQWIFAYATITSNNEMFVFIGNRNQFDTM